MKYGHTFLILVLFVISSCALFDDHKLASVGDEVLYYSEFERYAEVHDINLNDEQALQLFIDNWVENELVNNWNKIENETSYNANLLKSKDVFNELNLFDAENRLINQVFDSIVSEDEILTFYENNRNNYLTESFIVKALYIKVPDSIKGVDEIKDAFMLKKDKDVSKVLDFSNLYATVFYFEKEKWIFLEDLVKDIPINESKKNEIIKNRGHAYFHDGDYFYFINVFDFKIKKTSAPLEFERENIRNHILKRRINKERLNLKEKIIEDAKRKIPVEFY